MEKFIEILKELNKEATTIDGIKLTLKIELSEPNFEKMVLAVRRNELENSKGSTTEVTITHKKELDK